MVRRASIPWLLLVALAAMACSTAVPDPPAALVPVRVDRVALDAHDAPVVILEEADGPRWLPIWIGAAEARSIALQIGERTSPRPNSHDLAQRLIQRLDGEVVRVVVTDLQAGIYFAVLSLRRDGETVDIDARPSDAIAIALRTGAPIFVREELLDGAREPGDDLAPTRDESGQPI